MAPSANDTPSSPWLAFGALLDHRAQPPRPWLDDRCDWAEAEFSKDFARTASLGPGRARQEASFLASRLDPEAKVLDLGCGEGRTSRALVEKLPKLQVLGIDLGPGAIALAQAKPRPGLQFRVGDFFEDTYPEGPFEAAFCIDGGLAGFPEAELEVAIQRLSPALKPQALLVLELPSLAMAESLDQRQDWYSAPHTPAGPGPQLVLTEDFYHREESVYQHRMFLLNLESGAVQTLVQSYRVYALDELVAGFEALGFSFVEAFGGFWEEAYAEEESPRLVAVFRAP